MTLIKACLNGSRTAAEHPAIPLSPEQLAEAAHHALMAGAGALHIHPRRADGTQALNAETHAEALAAVRKRCPGARIGVSTGEWIEPDPALRLAHVRQWRVLPDFASVNFNEPDAIAMAEALLARGIGVEAGIADEADVAALRASGLAARLLRVLIEPEEQTPAQAERAAKRVIHALDAAHIAAPRLLHGSNTTAWPILRVALTLGYATRIGLEDTLFLPSGERASHNGELVAAAVVLAQRMGRL